MPLLSPGRRFWGAEVQSPGKEVLVCGDMRLWSLKSWEIPWPLRASVSPPIKRGYHPTHSMRPSEHLPAPFGVFSLCVSWFPPVMGHRLDIGIRAGDASLSQQPGARAAWHRCLCWHSLGALSQLLEQNWTQTRPLAFLKAPDPLAQPRSVELGQGGSGRRCRARCAESGAVQHICV